MRMHAYYSIIMVYQLLTIAYVLIYIGYIRIHKIFEYGIMNM